CHNLGLTFRQLADWPHAEDAVSEAVRHAALVGERSLLALVIAGRAELELERGEYEMARQALARSAELAHAAGDGIGAAEVGRLRALLALRVGDYPGAAREAEAARAEAERLGSALLQAECAAAAARAWRALGHAEEAEARRAEAERLFRSLGAVRLLEDLAASWR
ncbi:MAG TPA: hypothetical protein VNK43_06675, partial [Gemmatimonadales bacterium]|nr:hypothetical protein [Gemmatimonadales bacterium]